LHIQHKDATPSKFIKQEKTALVRICFFFKKKRMRTWRTVPLRGPTFFGLVKKTFDPANSYPLGGPYIFRFGEPHRSPRGGSWGQVVVCFCWGAPFVSSFFYRNKQQLQQIYLYKLCNLWFANNMQCTCAPEARVVWSSLPFATVSHRVQTRCSSNWACTLHVCTTLTGSMSGSMTAATGKNY